VTVRVDPVRLRVTARFGGPVFAVAGGVLWSFCCRRGEEVMGFGRVDARTLRPHSPLVVKDAAGRRQPVGWLAVGADAVWTVAAQNQRLWRVPLAGGAARAVLRVPGFPYGLAADAGAVWMLSGTGSPGSQRDRSGRPAPGPAHRGGHRDHATAGPGCWHPQRRGRARRWRWRGLARRSLLAGVARWRHPAAGRSRFRVGGRVASRPTLVLPGVARRRAARGVGGHRGAPTASRGCGVAIDEGGSRACRATLRGNQVRLRLPPQAARTAGPPRSRPRRAAAPLPRRASELDRQPRPLKVGVRHRRA
jgi:hypothetical protein